ncbi:MAG: hypothetical protein [Arizlama microvirus]|nr:MAG: hypothetical protein [Arizlama microvirus]
MHKAKKVLGKVPTEAKSRLKSPVGQYPLKTPPEAKKQLIILGNKVIMKINPNINYTNSTNIP